MYFILTIFLFFSLAILGYQLSKRKHLKMIHFTPVILIYTLIEGLRYGRGIDYDTYYGVFTDIVKYDKYIQGTEPIFLWLCKIIGMIGLNYQCLILICSFVLILSGCYILKEHKEVLTFSLPLFAYTCLIAETVFRFYLGFSFILVAIIAINNQSYKKAIFWGIIATLIHYALLPIIILFILISFRKKIILKPLYSCIIYTLLILIWKSSTLLSLLPFFSILDGVDRYASYTQNIEGFLTGEHKEEVILATSTWIRITITHIFLIICGYYQAIKRKGNIIYVYNILLIGILSFPICYKVELLNRYNSLFLFFQCIIGGYCFRYTNKYKLIVILAFCMYFINIFNIARQPNPKERMFIWDAPTQKNI